MTRGGVDREDGPDGHVRAEPAPRVRGPARRLATGYLDAASRQRRLDRLHVWARRHAERHWPDDTPEHLARDYFALLRAGHDVAGMVAFASDTDRHDRCCCSPATTARGHDEMLARLVRAAPAGSADHLTARVLAADWRIGLPLLAEVAPAVALQVTERGRCRGVTGIRRS